MERHTITLYRSGVLKKGRRYYYEERMGCNIIKREYYGNVIEARRAAKSAAQIYGASYKDMTDLPLYSFN